MIRILTTSYNCKNYVNMNIASLQAQNNNDWVCYITEDMSTDGTSEYIKELIKEDGRFVLIENKTKMYQPGNYWQVLQREEIDDEDICITLDGDDWLASSEVLRDVIGYYEDGNTLMTCGNFVHYHAPEQYSPGFTYKPEPFNHLRNLRWTSTHLRTFKAHMFRKIKKEHLIAPSGNFWETCGDLAFMIPMLDMAGEDRVKYVQDVNMVYNVHNPLNDWKVDLPKQNEYAELLRQRERYDLI